MIGNLRSLVAIGLLAWGLVCLTWSEPWAYLPLTAAMTACGLLSMRTSASDPLGRALSISLAGIGTAILVQLVPLPADVVRAVSPAAMQVVRVPARPDQAPLPLSVNPRATLVGLVFVTALSLFFVGVARLLRRHDARRLAEGLAVLGTSVALVGIVEQSTSWQGVYGALGFPLPPDSTPLGPFASRNHFAAWILMALPLTLGHLCAILERHLKWTQGGIDATHPVWVVLAAFAATTMALALIQTRSRAGILGLVAALAVTGVLLVRRFASPKTRILIAAPLILVPLMGVAVTGLQPVAERFATDSWLNAHGRLPIWRQATAIARDFPITGSGFNTYQSIVRFYPAADIDEPYEGAHNDVLQLAIEGGLLVGIPVLSTAAFFVRQTYRRFVDSSDDPTTRWIRIGAVMGLLLISMQEMVDFSLQVPANAALFVVLAAIAIHRSETGAYV